MGSGHGGRREGSGRKPNIASELSSQDELGTHPGPTSGVERKYYGDVIDALDKAPGEEEKKSLNLQRWRKLVDSKDERIVLDTYKYLFDKRDGKAIQPVDVDATLDAGVIIDLGPLMPKEFRNRGRAGKTPNR